MHLKELEQMTDSEIISEMELLNSTKPQTINGARGASIRYKMLSDELDNRSYQGVRPPKIFSPPSILNE